MRKIVYYVASSLDGFIAGAEEDISGFIQKGPGVDVYMQDLQQYDTVIMGKNTYTFGYQYGLQPGQPGYPHMQHHIFSRSLVFENPSEKVRVEPLDLERIRQLKEAEGSDIYLCGGGTFAGWLLDHGMIDVLKLKLNPLILGQGTRLFGNSERSHALHLEDQQSFEDGLQILTYSIQYT